MNAMMIPQPLTAEEQDFLYHIEVLGVPVHRASQLTNVRDFAVLLKRPDFLVARQKMQDSLRANTAYTREQIIERFDRAIDQAYILGEPMAQIAGVKEIAKMLGYDTPKKVEISLNDNTDIRKKLRDMSASDLVTLVDDAADIIDADFYPSA